MGKSNQISKDRASVLRKNLHAAVEHNAHTSWKLCEAMYHSYYSVVVISNKTVEVWRLWGYKSWEDFVEKEAGLHYNTAHSYKNVYDKFGFTLAGKWPMSALLPVTKMRLLTYADLTPNNVQAWMRRAADMSCCKLEDLVFNGDGAIKLTLTGLSEKDKRDLQRAIDVAKRDFGEDVGTNGQAVAFIVREWLGARKVIRKVAG